MLVVFSSVTYHTHEVCQHFPSKNQQKTLSCQGCPDEFCVHWCGSPIFHAGSFAGVKFPNASFFLKTAKFEGLHLLTSSPPQKKTLCVGNLMIIPARFQGLSVCSKHYPLTRQILYPSIFFQRRLDKWYLTSLAAPTR